MYSFDQQGVIQSHTLRQWMIAGNALLLKDGALTGYVGSPLDALGTIIQSYQGAMHVHYEQNIPISFEINTALALHELMKAPKYAQLWSIVQDYLLEAYSYQFTTQEILDTYTAILEQMMSLYPAVQEQGLQIEQEIQAQRIAMERLKNEESKNKKLTKKVENNSAALTEKDRIIQSKVQELKSSKKAAQADEKKNNNVISAQKGELDQLRKKLKEQQNEIKVLQDKLKTKEKEIAQKPNQQEIAKSSSSSSSSSAPVVVDVIKKVVIKKKKEKPFVHQVNTVPAPVPAPILVAPAVIPDPIVAVIAEPPVVSPPVLSAHYAVMRLAELCNGMVPGGEELLACFTDEDAKRIQGKITALSSEENEKLNTAADAINNMLDKNLCTFDTVVGISIFCDMIAGCWNALIEQPDLAQHHNFMIYQTIAMAEKMALVHKRQESHLSFKSWIADLQLLIPAFEVFLNYHAKTEETSCVKARIKYITTTLFDETGNMTPDPAHAVNAVTSICKFFFDRQDVILSGKMTDNEAIQYRNAYEALLEGVKVQDNSEWCILAMWSASRDAIWLEKGKEDTDCSEAMSQKILFFVNECKRIKEFVKKLPEQLVQYQHTVKSAQSKKDARVIGVSNLIVEQCGDWLLSQCAKTGELQGSLTLVDSASDMYFFMQYDYRRRSFTSSIEKNDADFNEAVLYACKELSANKTRGEFSAITIKGVIDRLVGTFDQDNLRAWEILKPMLAHYNDQEDKKPEKTVCHMFAELAKRKPNVRVTAQGALDLFIQLCSDPSTGKSSEWYLITHKLLSCMTPLCDPQRSVSINSAVSRFKKANLLCMTSAELESDELVRAVLQDILIAYKNANPKMTIEDTRKIVDLITQLKPAQKEKIEIEKQEIVIHNNSKRMKKI